MTPAELVAARTSLGLGQAALARALGMSTTAVWRWEKGERPIPPWLPLALRGLERPDRLGAAMALIEAYAAARDRSHAAHPDVEPRAWALAFKAGFDAGRAGVA